MRYRTTERRLQELEAAYTPPGPVICVNATYDKDYRHRTPDEAAALIADAHRRAGPHGTVVIIQHVDGDEWRANRGQEDTNDQL